MALIEYALDEHVAILTMNSGENRFNPTFLTAFLDVLDTLEKDTQANTLIVTSSHEKIFSNGLDLEWLTNLAVNKDVDSAKNFFFQLNKLFKKVVTYPMITIAAINGHAFAGGAILSCAFDFRFMRSDRGFFCFPEVDLGIPFLPGMNALLKKAMPMYKVEEMEYTGNRLTAAQCEEHNIITKACNIEQLMEQALGFAKTLNKKREVVREIKKRLNAGIVHALDV